MFKITIPAVYSFFSKYKFAINVLQFHVYFPAGLKFLYHNRDNNSVVSHWSVLTKFRKSFVHIVQVVCSEEQFRGCVRKIEVSRCMYNIHTSTFINT